MKTIKSILMLVSVILSMMGALQAGNGFIPLVPKDTNIELVLIDSIARDRFDNIYVGSSNTYIYQDGIEYFAASLDKNGNLIKRLGERNQGGFACVDGKLHSIGGIGVDKINDFIYISDKSDNCIQKFDLNGNFITSWGSAGGLQGQMNSPRGIDVDSNGNVYVVDRGNNRIQKFTSDGTYIRSWGGAGNTAGHFNEPFKIAIDGSNVYITDSSNFRVQVFDLNGIFLRMWGGSRADFNFPYAITADNNHNVYVTDGSHILRKFDSFGNLLLTCESESHPAENLAGAYSMIVGSNNKIYIGVGHSIQIYDSNLNQLDSWGEYGSGVSEFYRPTDIVSDSNGNFYVLDSGNHRIQKFKKNGDFILKWGKEGTGISEFRDPSTIAIDSDNKIYVVDSGNERIQKFDSHGNFIMQWSTDIVQTDNHKKPSGIAIDANDNVYVTEIKGDYFDNKDILKFNKNGILLNTFKTDSNIDLIDIAIDANFMYIITGNSEVLKLNHQGVEVARWGAFGKNIGEFTNPKHIHLDRNGHVYVSDRYTVQEFDANGNFVYWWKDSEKQFSQPKGITTDIFGNILLVSSNDFYSSNNIYDPNRKKIEAGVMRLERNPDVDHDGVNNDQDAFPFDPNERMDSDNDGVGNNADTDDDNDGISDSLEIANGLNPLNPNDAQADFDNDGFSNAMEIQVGTNIRNASNKPIWAPIIMGDIITFVLVKS